MVALTVACAKPKEKKRTGPITITIDVVNYDQDTACAPTLVKFKIKSESRTKIRIAGVEGTTDSKGIWLAEVPSATLQKLAATKKRVPVNATRGERTGKSSYSLHLVGKTKWLKRYPKGLESVKLDKKGWDSAYLGCKLVKASPSAGRAKVIEGKLVHWVIPYSELSSHVRFSGTTDKKAAASQNASVSLTVTNGAGKTTTLKRDVSVVGDRYVAFLRALKKRATKADNKAPPYKRGKGAHALLYFDGKDKLDASLARGKLAGEVALIATSTNRYQARLGPGAVTSCVYRTGNNRQSVPLLQVNPTIRVFSARTGKQVAKRSFRGRPPRCPEKLTSVADPSTGKSAPLESVLGALPAKKINAWLKSVAGQR